MLSQWIMHDMEYVICNLLQSDHPALPKSPVFHPNPNTVSLPCHQTKVYAAQTLLPPFPMSVTPGTDPGIFLPSKPLDRGGCQQCPVPPPRQPPAWLVPHR